MDDDSADAPNTTSRHPLHSTWAGMLSRCRNPSNRRFKHYGGRGISVCERWLTFANFVADMGERPEGMTLDRVNNDGNYEPGNCRWATGIQQRHNSRSVLPVTVNGVTKLLCVWARELGIGGPALHRRIKRHGPEKAIAMGGNQLGACASSGRSLRKLTRDSIRALIRDAEKVPMEDGRIPYGSATRLAEKYDVDKTYAARWIRMAKRKDVREKYGLP